MYVMGEHVHKPICSDSSGACWSTPLESSDCTVYLGNNLLSQFSKAESKHAVEEGHLALQHTCMLVSPQMTRFCAHAGLYYRWAIQDLRCHRIRRLQWRVSRRATAQFRSLQRRNTALAYMALWRHSCRHESSLKTIFNQLKSWRLKRSLSALRVSVQFRMRMKVKMKVWSYVCC